MSLRIPQIFLRVPQNSVVILVLSVVVVVTFCANPTMTEMSTVLSLIVALTNFAVQTSKMMNCTIMQASDMMNCRMLHVHGVES